MKEVNATDKVLDWLLEPDDVGVRFLALRDLVKADAGALALATKQAHTRGPIARVLSRMDKEGFWVKPGVGYSPLYTATIWSVVMLAQLGAAIDMDMRIATACAYVLGHSLTKHGQFTASGWSSGTQDCLQGMLCYALLDLGCKDSRLDMAFEYIARSVTGDFGGLSPAR
jgi:hypothetical protein